MSHKHLRLLRPLKWLGLLCCLVLSVTFVAGTKRAVIWDSRDLRHEVGVMLGAISFAWRPAGWQLGTARYPPTAGFSVAWHNGTSFVWWIQTGKTRAWEWVSIPLWMPFLLIVVPTSGLWYSDRRATAAALRRLSDWLRPEHCRRVTVWTVLAFCVLHIVLLWVGETVFTAVSSFLLPQGRPNSADTVLLVCFWGTPAWATLWACGYVKLLNTLFDRQPGCHCTVCGYNLTGNISGVCPECGTAIEGASSSDSHRLPPEGGS